MVPTLTIKLFSPQSPLHPGNRLPFFHLYCLESLQPKEKLNNINSTEFFCPTYRLFRIVPLVHAKRMSFFASDSRIALTHWHIFSPSLHSVLLSSCSDLFPFHCFTHWDSYKLEICVSASEPTLHASSQLPHPNSLNFHSRRKGVLIDPSSGHQTAPLINHIHCKLQLSIDSPILS